MEDRSIRKRRFTDDDSLPAHVVAASTPPPLAAAATAADVVVSTHTAPSTGSNSESTHASPPPKRRLFTPNDNVQEDLITSGANVEDVVLNYHKDGIWRQMLDYKREFSKAQDRVTQLQERQVDYEAHLSTVELYWKKLLFDLGMILSRIDITLEAKDLVLDDGTNFASFFLNSSGDHLQLRLRDMSAETLKPALTFRLDQTKGIVHKIISIIQDWAAVRSSFLASLDNSDVNTAADSVIQKLKEEQQRISALHKKSQSDIDQLQNQSLGFADQVAALKKDLETNKGRLEEASEGADESKDRLRRFEKGLDREKSSIVTVVTSGAIFGENYTTTPDAATPSSGPADSKNDITDASRDELLQSRDQAIARLTELEELKSQRVLLKNDVDHLRMQLNHLPDDRVQDSQHVKSLLAQMQYARNDADHYRNESNKLRVELEGLQQGRRKFMENLEVEEKSRRTSLEGELKKLENDISRLRDSRDRFQQMYEARCTKDDYEMQQNQEIRKIANTRKDRITTLATDIQRLQIMLAANTGDKDAFAFYFSAPPDKSFLDDMKNKVKASDEQIRVLTQELEAAKEATTQLRGLEAVLFSEQKLKYQVEEMTNRLAKLEGLVGSSPEEDLTKTLTATIQAKEEVIRMLGTKVQAHEAVQAPLLTELQTVATAWGQLEEATSRKVIDLAQKEDLIFKLLSEKTRQESKCNLLIRAKDASANMTAVMKRQSDMQLDQIRKLEERERNLNMQMAALEREQALLHSSVETHKSKLQECIQQNAGYKEKFARQEERLVDLVSTLKDRTEAFEHEEHARKRLVEETEFMKRRIDEQAKVESQSGENSEAAKQAARYLKLLKCPSCDLNFKSHVILRCMHVFCKSCMDNQLEFRQRKCPTCRESFGAKDVKEIYL
ncbi:E3 ubiquitin-protein ligase bre1 [Lunasporangiospora selenospora]|uniref:E3 ubiquitin protein ligase n=1 Tax=Lunasporangiospora selenospora TaxID=979761 RepID=A0A9P6KFB2_9FUNG|nr:E3 ubiquitin-protein ligase bre1 [Lunasporangiospora selenospora]